MKTIEHEGKAVEYIEATLEDIATANRLAAEVLGRSLDELPPQTRRLLELLDGWVTKETERLKKGRADFLFSRRDRARSDGLGRHAAAASISHVSSSSSTCSSTAAAAARASSTSFSTRPGADGRAFVPSASSSSFEELRYVRHAAVGAKRGAVGPRSAPGRRVVGPWADRSDTDPARS